MESDQATLHNIQEQATKELTTRTTTRPPFLKHLFQSHMLEEFQSRSEGFLKVPLARGLTVGASAVDSVRSKDLCVFQIARFLSDWFYF